MRKAGLLNYKEKSGEGVEAMFRIKPSKRMGQVRSNALGVVILAVALLFASGCAEEHRVELAAEPEEGGSVDGAGSYEHEALVAVQAEPAEGYVFAGWSEAGEVVSEDETYRFEAVEDRNLTALFEEKAADMEVALFFGHRDAIDTGQTGEYGYVTPFNIEISDPKDPEVLLQKVLEKLIKGPPAEEDLAAVIHEQLDILAVTVDPDEGVAEIDVCGEMFGEQWPGGSLPGTIFMQSVVLTATQFTEVNTVVVTVEGELWDDSHRVWDSPLGPDDVL